MSYEPHVDPEHLAEIARLREESARAIEHARREEHLSGQLLALLPERPEPRPRNRRERRAAPSA